MMKWTFLLLSLLVPTDIAAQDHGMVDGYVCSVWHAPPNPGTFTLGSHGHLFVRIAPDPQCAVNEVSAYFCSEGATNYLACDFDWLYSEAAMLNLHASLQRALIATARVNMRYTPHFPIASGRFVEFVAQ
jgi:hypothetical protein